MYSYLNWFILGKMTLEEIAEATELSLDIVKELESQSMQLS